MMNMSKKMIRDAVHNFLTFCISLYMFKHYES
jgi:hypothetical protein